MSIINVDTFQGLGKFSDALSTIGKAIARARRDRKEPAPKGFLQACDDASIVATREMKVIEEKMKLRGESSFRLAFLHKSGVMSPLVINGPPSDPRLAIQCATILRTFINGHGIAAYSISCEMWMATADNLEDLSGDVSARPDRIEAVAVRAWARAQPGKSAALLALTERKPDGSFDKLSPDVVSHISPGAQARAIGAFNISPLFQNMFEPVSHKPTVH